MYSSGSRQHPASFAIVGDPTLSLSYLNALSIGKQFRIAAVGLLIYDHLISLDREIELIWKKSKRHPCFYLYVFNRFFALSFYIFDSIPISYNGIVSQEVCVMYLTLDAIVTILSTLAVQIILQLRIYALYERNKKLLVTLITLCVAEALSMAVAVAIITISLFHTKIPDTSVGCAFEELPKTAFLFLLPGILYEPILCGLVAYKARSSVPRVPLISRIAQDSIIYFVGIFIELLVSALVWALAPQWINIVNPWSAALPSLLGSRLILNMREFVDSQQFSRSYIVEHFSTSLLDHVHDMELMVTTPQDNSLGLPATRASSSL